jgi:diadenosine tetraphosphate (Ap4A) HIT family hydrolase
MKKHILWLLLLSVQMTTGMVLMHASDYGNAAKNDDQHSAKDLAKDYDENEVIAYDKVSAEPIYNQFHRQLNPLFTGRSYRLRYSFSPQNALYPRLRLSKQTAFHKRHNTENDIFCKIIAGEKQEQFLFETARLIAFLNVDKTAHGKCTAQDTAVLIVPKHHVLNLEDLSREDFNELFAAGTYVAAALGQKMRDFFVNNGAHQTVSHLHLHSIVHGVCVADKFPRQTIHAWRRSKNDWRINRKTPNPRLTIALCDYWFPGGELTYPLAALSMLSSKL